MLEFSKLTCGNPCHPPLIFLHGFLGAKEDWEGMLCYFEKHFFCIAFDLPGHGSTPYSEDILSALKKEIQRFKPIPRVIQNLASGNVGASDLQQAQPFAKQSMCKHMLDAANCKDEDADDANGQILNHDVYKPILIGYSMGGRMALQLQKYADAIVVLSAHPGLSSKKEKEQRRELDALWCNKLLTLPFDTFLAEWYAQPLFCTLQHNPSLLQLIIQRRMKQNPHELANVMRQLSLSKQPYRRRFPRPTLFLHGEEDLKYQKLYCKLPNTVTVRSIKSAGHAIHLENAQACAEEILKWLKGTTYANT